VEISVDEATLPWKVREIILKIGSDSALRSQQWSEAHAFNTELIAAMKARGASEQELVHARLPGYTPLLNLGRHHEARELVAACQEFFKKEDNGQMLGQCRMALSQIEAAAGIGRRAPEHLLVALRYAYRARDVASVSKVHTELANALHGGGNDHPESLLHALAANLIDDLTGSARQHRSLLSLALCLSDVELAVPESLHALCNALEELPGIHLRNLLTDHGREWQEADERYFDVLLAAKAESGRLFFDAHDLLALWDPLLAGIYLGFCGSRAIAQAAGDALTVYGQDPDWADLVPLLRDLQHGWTSIRAASALHPINAAIVSRGFERRRSYEPADIPSLQHLWDARHLAPLFHAVVAGVRGNRELAVKATQVLDGLPRQPHMITLVRGLRRILAGDFDNALSGHDDVTDAILRAVLEHAAAPDAQSLLEDASSLSMSHPEDV
jgi:hypothetical protein